MKREDAEKLIGGYIKPIYGFALKRCKNLQDAEDLSQEILIKAYTTLTCRDDIRDMNKFIWTIAHNMLNNYYRDSARCIIGVPLDELMETLSAPADEEGDEADAISRLQCEIAYLSKLQRRILIAYYFENRKQADIASELSIPLGTVKWHLFEAKKT